MSRSALVVALGGTLRANSSTENVLRAVLARASSMGARVQLFDGAALNFPMYEPGAAIMEEPISAFLTALRNADAVVLGSPGYHGGISGLVKNAIDYTEEMANDPVPYLTNKPVGCVATGSGWQGCNSTLQALRAVVHALRGWPTPIGIAVNTRDPSFDVDGNCTNHGLEAQIAVMAEQLLSMHKSVETYERWESSG